MQSTKRLLLVENGTTKEPRTRQAFEAIGVARVVRTSSMEEAMGRLSGDPGDRPSLIVLDFDAFCTDGIEFLRTIKDDSRLCSIPVIILTSSHDDDPMPESFAWGAAGYIVKPDDDARFLKAIEAIDRYWTLSRVPTHSW